MKLKSELPMTSVMYLKLVNKFAHTTQACVSCRHPNGECVSFARKGTCNAMDRKINDVLVFHDGTVEFATTRLAVAHALETNQENEENPWIGETVDAVIEDYTAEAEFEKENMCASTLYNLLSNCDIITEIDWE